MDKISRLPDDILLVFLSKLDLKTARRTCVLSKRWRYLWTWRTDLDLDTCNMSPDNYGCFISDPIGYLKWVNQIVNAHRSPFISKFRVVFDNAWSKDKSLVGKWVMFALSKRVEELELALSSRGEEFNFSLGFDILKHPLCFNGIINLKSLYLTSVHVSGEFLEFILLHCRHLERLFVYSSKDLHTLNIVSNKLKRLTLISCRELTVLEIDAVNLISFKYEDLYYDANEVRARLVFKNVPNLVEMDVAGDGCLYPFPILKEISYLPKQLTKLSFSPNFDFSRLFTEGRWEMDVHFPNVKQLTFTLHTSLSWLAVMVIKLFIDACPKLHELKIQMIYVSLVSGDVAEEAKQLQVIELEDERIDEISKDQNSYSAVQKEQLVNHVDGDGRKSHPNLKVLEVVGFCGSDSDVEGALDIIDDARCIEKLICNTGRVNVFGGYLECVNDVERGDKIRRRARKLAKLVPPNVHVGVVNRSGLFWVS